MKKILYSLLAVNLVGCTANDKLSDESSLMPSIEHNERINPQNELDRYLYNNVEKPYNISVLYQFIEEEVDRTYTFSPVRYEKAVEFANIFKYLFIEPYVKMTSQKFLNEHSFRTLILIGDPAFNPNGSKLVGLAVAGVKIHLTEINNTEPNNIYWLNDNILVTLYHENAHTWHQAKLFSTEYERISATDYKRDNWITAWDRNTSNFLPAGFITAYSSYNSNEDFVELLARYIVYYNATLDCGCATTDTSLDTNGDGFNDALYTAWKAKFTNYGSLYDGEWNYYESSKVWEEELRRADSKIRPTETYTGKQKIEQKLAILKKYLTDEWHINLDELRAEIRSRYPYVVGSDFEGNPVPRKDFSVLTDD